MYSRLSILYLGLVLAVGACGIPQEQHDALLRDMQRCKSTLAETLNSLDTVTTERNKVKDQLAAAAGDKDALAKRLGATQDELTGLRKAREAAEERTKTYRKLLERLRAMIDSGKLQVTIRKGRMIVHLSDKILFDPGRKKLKKDGRAALAELAVVLKDVGGRDLLIAGHTDNIPIKTRRYRSNWELSAARAVEVVEFMQQEGVDPEHMAAAGYSKFDPVGDNSNDDGRRANRRIEIILMPKLAELPVLEK